MRNVLILGSGRSGTSMAAGVLSRTGYFMGEHLQELDEGNPKGYFEDLEINRINEDLLARVTPMRPAGIVGNVLFRTRLPHWQRWLARIPVGTPIPCQSHIAERIRAVTAHEPFCFKDPRFSYTLSAWHPFTEQAVLICVFRHPAITAYSIVKEAKRVSNFWKLHLSLNFQQALGIWECMYRHIVEIHYPKGGHWIFLHYNQFLDGSAFEIIEKKLGINAHREFIDRRLNRSKRPSTVPPRLLALYQQLCKLSRYRNEE